eukprot:1722076-Rhodomonas_salina.1
MPVASLSAETILCIPTADPVLAYPWTRDSNVRRRGDPGTVTGTRMHPATLEIHSAYCPGPARASRITSHYPGITITITSISNGTTSLPSTGSGTTNSNIY